MSNVPGERLESGSLRGAPLDLKGVFVLKEKIDGARRGGFPGSSRLKQNSHQQSGSCADDMWRCDYREWCCDKGCELLTKLGVLTL